MKSSNKKERIKVLFVDDDGKLLKSAKRCLTTLDKFDIDLASSVDEASEKVTKKKPEVVECDINLPGTNGLELLKMLREDGNNIPFIVFTVTKKKEIALKAFNLGANGFVGKSGDPEVVYSTLKRCIKESVNN